ncbi:MAG TPA: hypothetical protein DEP18_01565 [Flavobacteriales bacterium]|nr:hypothetical protein [Flavobacteriales bacterium]
MRLISDSMKKIILIYSLLFWTFQLKAQESRIETVLQRGHARPVTAIAFSADGKLMLSGSEDHSIILWNVQSGKQIRTFHRHTEAIVSIRFLKDGQRFISASKDQSVRLFDVRTGNLLSAMRIVKGELADAFLSSNGTYTYILDKRDGVHLYETSSGKYIRSAEKNYGAFDLPSLIDPTEQLILSSSEYKSACVLRIATGDTVLRLPFDKTYGMGFSSDGKFIVLSSAKLFSSIFDAKTGKQIAQLIANPDELCDGCNTAMAISNKGDMVLTKDNKSKGVLWQLSSGKKIRAFGDTKERPNFLRFTADDQFVVMAFDDEAEIYALASGNLIKKIPCALLRYMEPGISTDLLLALPTKLNDVELYDLRSGNKRKNIGGFLNSAKSDGLRFDPSSWRDQSILKFIAMKRSFAMSPDDRFIAFGNVDSTAFIIDLASGRIVNRLQGHSGVVYALDFSPDGKLLATAGADRSVCIWDAVTGKLIRKMKGHREVVFAVRFSRDGNWLASGSWDATFRLWNVHTDEFRVVDLGDVSPYTIAFSPGDLYVLTGDLGKGVHFWEVDAGQKFRSLIGHTGLVSAFDFSADGKLLVTASWDGKVKVWDVLTGMQTQRFALHEGPVFAAVFNPKENFAASGGSDHAILYWSLSDGKVKYHLQGHTAPVTHLRITGDGKKLVSFEIGRAIKIWDLQSGKELYSRTQIDRNEWISTTPGGRFDGSEKALRLVNYVSGVEVIPVGSLFEKYYTPGLIERINKGEDLGMNQKKMEQDISSAPMLSLQINQTQSRGEQVREDSVYKWTQDRFPVTIKVDARGAELDEIRLYNNGKLIAAEKYGENIQFRGGGKEVKHFDVPLQDGENHISAVVVNASKSESAPVEVIVRYDGTAGGTDLFLFSVGVNSYKNPQYDLKYAVNDAKSFAAAIKSGSQGLFQSVKEFSLSNKEATREKLLQTLELIRKEIGPEDVFVFYFAGHGTMSVERDVAKAEFFLVLHEVINLYDASEILAKKAFSASELKEWSVKLSAQKQLFVLDACHSGGAVDQLASRGDGREKAIAQLARSTGTFFLTASQDAQFANEAGQLNHGLFTFALLEVLQGKTNDRDGKVMVNELRIHAEERVPELAEKMRGSAQYPVSYSFGQDFPVVMLK